MSTESPTIPRPTTTFPGPPGDRVVGMARQLRGDLLGTLLENFDRYGDSVSYRVGPSHGPRRLRREMVALHHPDSVRRVLADEQTFTRQTASFRVLAELFGENLVTSSGSTWTRQKRMLQPLFTPRNVARYAELIEREAHAVLDREPLAAGSDGLLDLVETTERFALRVLGHTLFQDERGIDEETVDALERLVPQVGTQVRSRAGQVAPLPLRWPTPRNRRFVETRTALYATIDRLLERRASREGPAPDDLLGRLQHPEQDRAASPQEIRDQALIFLISGHTTTSNALISTLYLLGRHPRTQEAVAEAAVGAAPDDPEHDLVRAAVQEGLRLQPPAYVIGRRTSDETEVDGRTIPAGAAVLVSPWVTHRHPRFWSDPTSFDPERFVGRHDRHPYAYFPFGGGARACIGKHFAMLEATILVRALLSRYRLESLDREIATAQLISLRPAGPVHVRCVAR